MASWIVRRRILLLAGGLLGGLLATGTPPSAAAAEISAAAAQRLTAALHAGSSEELKLTWTIGRAAESREELRIEGGQATLQRCAARPDSAEPSADASCQAVGTPLTLTAGQREQLLSVLRAAELPHLSSADADARAATDRALELVTRAAAPLRWQLMRSEWPTPPDGYGPAEFLDELARTLRHSAQARQPVPIPTTVAELNALRLQLRLTPRTRPGGLVTIEHGLIHVTPAEGSLPRSPLPRSFERPLAPGEAEQLVSALQAAQLDGLDQRVPKRAAPAIGDEDGRLATIHLLRAEPVEPVSAGKSGRSLLKPDPAASAAAARVEPRGIERYLADLMRSPAQPLCQKLVAMLLSEPPAATAIGAKAKGRAH